MKPAIRMDHLSRRDFIGKSAIGLTAAAVLGRIPDWLVAWPSALRLITLTHWTPWSDFGT
jgi:hypothetical protein